MGSISKIGGVDGAASVLVEGQLGIKQIGRYACSL